MDVAGNVIVSQGISFTGSLVSGTGIGSSGANGDLRLYAGGTQYVTVQNNGNVGIGTTNTQTMLNVNSASGIDATLRLSNPDGNYLDIATKDVTGFIEYYSKGNNVDQTFYVTKATVKTPVMTLDGAAGNIGIGTTTPSYKLHVSGADETVLYASKTASGTPAMIVSGGYIIMDGGAYGIRGAAGQGMYLGANNVDVIYINPQGNIGIGTTSPAAKLHVVGTKADGAQIKLQDTESDGNTLLTFTAYNGAGYIIGRDTTSLSIANNMAGIAIGSNGDISIGKSTYVKLDTGNVGIGTASPSTKLEISGSATNYPIITLKDADSSGANAVAGIQFKDKDGTITGFIADSNEADSNIYLENNVGNLIFGDLSGEVIRTNNGKVGIGTSSPDTQLHVKGPGSVVGGAFRVETYMDPNALYVMNFGNVGIGTTNPQYKLTVGTSGNQIGYYSDANHYAYWTPYDSSGQMIFNNYWSSGTADIHFQPDNNLVIETGSVGIGTTSPSSKLDVVTTTGSNVVTIQNAGSGWSSINFKDNAGNLKAFIGYGNSGVNPFGSVAYLGATGDLVIGPGNSEKVRFTSAGDVKINKLAGSGNAYACVNANGQLYRSAAACS